MGEKTYEELVVDILYVDGRISKAKLAGILVGILIFLGDMIYIIPHSLRMGVTAFLITMLFVFFQILLYYGICRGGGYLIRRFLIK